MSKTPDKSLGNCEFCGANMDIVGKAHVCRPNRSLSRTEHLQARNESLKRMHGPTGGEWKGAAKKLAAKQDIDTSDIPEATKDDFKRSKTTRMRPKTKVIDVPDGPDKSRQVTVETLRRKTGSMALPDPHPDCPRCKEQARRSRDRMRVRRSSFVG